VKVLIAPDKFKGSLTSLAAAEAIARGWAAGWPGCEVELAPIADGGEGFAAVLLHALKGEWVEVQVEDPLGRPVSARYVWAEKEKRAVIEMSEASGLWRLSGAERDPLRAHTFGTGELMRDAIASGAVEILVGLGGSASTDGGMGMAAALGYVFEGRDGEALEPFPCNLPAVARIHRSAVPPLPRVIAACDVENPLLGARGTAHVFAPQKGATRENVAFLEDGLRHMARVVQRDLGTNFAETAGAGAAGGLGFGLLSFCGATVSSGFQIVSEALQLEGRIAAADLVITAEGRLDGQTLDGKGPAGVAALARAAGKPVMAYGGSIEDESLLRGVFDAVCPIICEPLSLSEAIARGGELLEDAARRTSSLVRISSEFRLQ